MVGTQGEEHSHAPSLHEKEPEECNTAKQSKQSTSPKDKKIGAQTFGA